MAEPSLISYLDTHVVVRDLLIVATAMANNNAPLVTKDERIRGGYNNAIW